MFRRFSRYPSACYRILDNGHYLKLQLPQGRPDLDRAVVDRRSLLQACQLDEDGLPEVDPIPYHQAVSYLQDEPHRRHLLEIARWVRGDLSRQRSYQQRRWREKVTHVLDNGQPIDITAPYGFHDLESIAFQRCYLVPGSDQPTTELFRYSDAISWWSNTGQTQIRDQMVRLVREKQTETLRECYPSTEVRVLTWTVCTGLLLVTVAVLYD